MPAGPSLYDMLLGQMGGNRWPRMTTGRSNA